jgi:hypothetical protein
VHERRVSESFGERNITPIFVNFISHLSSDSSVTGGVFNSEITNNFGDWVVTIRFLFLKFNFETFIGDLFMSGNNGIRTIFGLTLG